MREHLINSHVVYECPIFKVEHALVELPGGQRAERWYAIKSDVAGVIAVDDLGCVLLTREYRSASREVRWRIPVGSIKPDETPQEAARRELREETGFDATRLTLLLSQRRPSGWIKQVSHFFLAEGLFESPLSSAEVEQIELHRLAWHEVEGKITNGEVSHVLTLALERALSLLSSRPSS